ncbi:hypothetical protein GWI33_005812 [Rhynchophorus ferrugineus]|uniref:Uncharacterized protein n=1 Tax=Rhynchophorus ferrugineus TaxID=354439 RepID=A0A834IJW9_RHYFE|nr:hypothetical protein GWI33_005812 [Rhynchophorus ferrugineus]
MITTAGAAITPPVKVARSARSFKFTDVVTPATIELLCHPRRPPTTFAIVWALFSVCVLRCFADWRGGGWGGGLTEAPVFPYGFILSIDNV